MTLHQLKIFECVVRHMNITKASAALHISQPSVSQQLKLLEEEFGTKFFIRLNQGVELTSEGEEFFNGIRTLLAEAEDLEKRFKSSPTLDTVPLIVGGSHNVSVNVLPKLLMSFKTCHPSVQVVLETNESPIIENRLIAAEVEIALITNPSYRAEIIYEPYEEMELVAFCLPSSPLGPKEVNPKGTERMPARAETRWQAGKGAYEFGIQDEYCIAMRGIRGGKGRCPNGDGSRNLVSNRYRQPGCQGQSKGAQRSGIEAAGDKIVCCL